MYIYVNVFFYFRIYQYDVIKPVVLLLSTVVLNNSLNNSIFSVSLLSRE